MYFHSVSRYRPVHNPFRPNFFLGSPNGHGNLPSYFHHILQMFVLYFYFKGFRPSFRTPYWFCPKFLPHA